MLNRTVQVCAVLLVLCFLVAFPTAGQVTTADISGHVSDPKGLAVLGARIRVASAATGFARETTTLETGDFAVNKIPPGNYKITIEQQGFQTAVFESVELVVGENRTFDVTLKIGSSSQTVLITEEAPLVETTSSEI